MIAVELTQEYLKSVLDYNPETGAFTNLVARKQSRKGAVAGSITSKGYLRIKLLNREHSAHRLAWMYVYGVWPSKCLDHVNRHRADNRIANLREATYADNRQNINTPSSNTSGYLGVTWNKKARKWQAGIKFAGVSFHLGLHDSAEAAHAAYLCAKYKYHKFNQSKGPSP